MQPSLTPHLDAVRRVSTRAQVFDDPADAAAHRAFMAVLMEAAALMDAGRKDLDVLAFVEAVTASIIDSIATSAASGHADSRPVRSELIAAVIRAVAARLAGPSDYSDREIVASAPAGRA